MITKTKQKLVFRQFFALANVMGNKLRKNYL